jgi:ABC-2 type transport system ATP-binding protein
MDPVTAMRMRRTLLRTGRFAAVADAVIEVRGLHKSYGDHAAVRGIDLTVGRGECFAFLGPNGAGKTTTVEILEGYRDRTAGEVRVLGVDPARADARWRSRIGIVLQSCQLADELTVRETVQQFAGYYPRPRPVDETIEQVGLGSSRDVRVKRLSGGQQRRLDVALALVGDPELLFLDEPTTGFDPAARRSAWDLVAGLTALGKTVFLTTHYLDEAQALADRIAILAGGEIVAEGTPDDIGGRSSAAAVVRFRAARTTGLGRAVRGVTTGVDGVSEVATDDPVRTLHALTGWAIERGVDLADLRIDRPSLEDVYLQLTREPA